MMQAAVMVISKAARNHYLVFPESGRIVHFREQRHMRDAVGAFCEARLISHCDRVEV